MSDVTQLENITIESIRTARDANWGWPSCLILTLRLEDGSTLEAAVSVYQWHNPATGARYSPG